MIPHKTMVANVWCPTGLPATPGLWATGQHAPEAGLSDLRLLDFNVAKRLTEGGGDCDEWCDEWCFDVEVIPKIVEK